MQESIDVELDIDVSYITNPISSIADDVDAVVNLPGNAVQAVENTGKAAINFGNALLSNDTGVEKDGILEEYQGKIRGQELALQLKITMV